MQTTISKIEWLPFRLPYTHVFVTAHGHEHARTGVILRLSTSDLMEGLGEATPVSAFNAGTAGDVLSAIERLAPHLIGQTLGEAGMRLRSWYSTAPGMSAVCCAIDTALCDLQARMLNISLAQLLGGDTAQPIDVHATIGTSTIEATCTAARQAIDQGFRCIKIKVGSAGTPGAELERIDAIRQAIGPQARLRVDANGAWSVKAAIAILRAAARYNLDLVEQPVAADDLEGMRRVRASVDIPIAADESVWGTEQARRVIAAEAADLLVVKPMLAGGPRPALEIIAIASAARVRAFVTTTIDAGVANSAALHVAATLPAPRLICGLATAHLLVADLIKPTQAIHQGTMTISGRPGLGVTLDPAQLKRYGTQWCGVPNPS